MFNALICFSIVVGLSCVFLTISLFAEHFIGRLLDVTLFLLTVNKEYLLFNYLSCTD